MEGGSPQTPPPDLPLGAWSLLGHRALKMPPTVTTDEEESQAQH